MSSPIPPSSTSPTKISRPARYPAGRCGVARFCEITGIGRTTFFTKLRKEPFFIERLDIRQNPENGYLSMNESRARDYARQRTGQLVTVRQTGNVSEQEPGAPAPTPQVEAVALAESKAAAKPARKPRSGGKPRAIDEAAP